MVPSTRLYGVLTR